MYYKIAGLTVAMDSFGRTVSQAAPYLIENPGSCDIKIESNWEALKEKWTNTSDEICEYMASGFNFYKQLLSFDGFMLHSSAVVVDGKAYLFSADSGTGKSTHTKIWLELFGDRAYILNDDKPALRLEDGVWYVYGTPWSGKYDISVNTRIPLGGIAMIERAEENEIYPFSGREAIRQVLAQTNRPRDIDSRTKLLGLLDKLFTKAMIWKLKCNMDKSAAILSYESMSGEKYKEN